MISNTYRHWRFVALAAAFVTMMLGCADEGPQVPNPPSGVTAAALSPTSVEVSWNSSSGATNYIVERAEGAGDFEEIGQTAASTFVDTGLAPNTQYRYRVSAENDQGTGNFSTVQDITTPQPFSALITQDIVADRTLYADSVYTLRGFIHVANGATLTIEAGTTILGDFNTLGSSLFVLRGARIRAMGTAERPIVFTSSRAAGSRQPGDWGGLILIGNGIINRSGAIELEGSGTVGGNQSGTNYVVTYSEGNNNADSSGELHYVRVEFAGFAPADGQELNSFTFAAVGSGTVLDHLQSLSGLDDSYEFFGGAADGSFLVSYESGDDHFDMSEGYIGRLRNLIALQTRVLQPRIGAGNVSGDPQGIENDGCAGAGCDNGQLSLPYTIPLVANFTLVGTGPGVVDNTNGGFGMVLRRGTGGYYVNGVVARWPKAAMSLRDQASTGARINGGDLQVRNILAADNAALQDAANIQLDAGANALVSSATATASLFTAFAAAPNSAADLDWTPPAGSLPASGGLAAFTGAIATKAAGFATGTTYRGAAAPGGEKWWLLWTNYASN